VPYIHFAGLDWLAITFSLFVIAFLRRNGLAIILALVAGISLGLYVGANAQANLASFEKLYGKNLTVEGTVSDDTTRGDSGDQRIKLHDIKLSGEPIKGMIWASSQTAVEIKRGDYVSLSGDVSPGFGTMHAALFEATLTDIHRPVPGDVSRVARDSFADKVQQHISQPQASLGVSFLVGQRSALPPVIQDMFRDLGLVHLVVASGFHLTIVVRFARKLFAGQSKYAATATSFMLIGGFLLLTGFSTSMVRASLVTGLSLLAWYYGRSIHPVILLLVVAAITVLINPLYILGDMAWHLSFAAFAGVIILAPLIHAYFWHPDKKPGFVRYLIIATTSAQITTFPIIAMAFEQYSPLALLSNLLVLPAVPIVMMATFLVGVSSFLLPWLATILAIPTQFGLRYITTVVEYLSTLPWAVNAVSMSGLTVMVYYAVVLLSGVYMQRITRFDIRSENPID
jgi:competence protein ComEC